MKTRLKTGIAFVALLACAETVLAANTKTMYVATTGSDSADGSQETPFLTVQKAIDSIEPLTLNDIVIADGTYALATPITTAIDPENRACGIRMRSASGTPGAVVIDGQNKCACLWNPDTQKYLSLVGLTFRNGFSSVADNHSAGGIYSARNIHMTNCVIQNCHHEITGAVSKPNGGGVCLIGSGKRDSKLTYVNVLPMIVDTRIENCSLTLHASNDQRVYGGGLSANNQILDRVEVVGCCATNDTPEYHWYALEGGGALLQYCSVSNCLFDANSSVMTSSTAEARGCGAGVYLDGSEERPSIMSDSRVINSRSAGSGSGVGVGSYVTLERVAITNNVCDSSVTPSGTFAGGGGVMVTGAHVAIRDCLIADNGTSAAAGGILIGYGSDSQAASDVSVVGSVIRNNRATSCGAMLIVNGDAVVVSNCVLTANQTATTCPGIKVSNNIWSKYNGQPVPASASCYGGVTVVDSFIVANTNTPATVGSGEGGVIRYSVGDLASNDQRGVYVSPLMMRNCLVSRNVDNSGAGWGTRIQFYNDARLTFFEGRTDDLIVFDHCTFEGNRNEGGGSSSFYFRGAMAAAYVKIVGMVFAENYYRNSGSTIDRTAGLEGANLTAGLVPNITYSHFDSANANLFTVTEENGNHLGKTDFTLGFTDPANYDCGIAKDSDLIERGGPFADWMGNGRKSSPARDLTGGFRIVSAGPYGVTVTRPNSRPRRYGNASDMGCCEWWSAPGLLLTVR